MYVYKHWGVEPSCMPCVALTWSRRCISEYDFAGVEQYAHDDMLLGIEELPGDYQDAVMESLEKSELIVPPMLDIPAPAKKTRAKKKAKKAKNVDDEASVGVSPIEKKVHEVKNDEADMAKGHGHMLGEPFSGREHSPAEAPVPAAEDVSKVGRIKKEAREGENEDPDMVKNPGRSMIHQPFSAGEESFAEDPSRTA